MYFIVGWVRLKRPKIPARVITPKTTPVRSRVNRWPVLFTLMRAEEL